MSEWYFPSEMMFRSWMNTMSSDEVEYAKSCMFVMKMAIERGMLLTIDLEEFLPEMPIGIPERQGYMIRQTCLDYAIQLEKEMDEQM